MNSDVYTGYIKSGRHILSSLTEVIIICAGMEYWIGMILDVALGVYSYVESCMYSYNYYYNYRLTAFLVAQTQCTRKQIMIAIIVCCTVPYSCYRTSQVDLDKICFFLLFLMDIINHLFYFRDSPILLSLSPKNSLHTVIIIEEQTQN